MEKKNPFKGDLNHLHHIVNGYTKNSKITLYISVCLFILPTLLLLINFQTYYILLISVVVYFLTIILSRLKIR